MPKGLVAVPVQQIRDALESGQTRLADIEEQLGPHYRDREISSALMLLIRMGELKVVPVGEHVSLQLVERPSRENDPN